MQLSLFLLIFRLLLRVIIIVIVLFVAVIEVASKSTIGFSKVTISHLPSTYIMFIIQV